MRRTQLSIFTLACAVVFLVALPSLVAQEKSAEANLKAAPSEEGHLATVSNARMPPGSKLYVAPWKADSTTSSLPDSKRRMCP